MERYWGIYFPDDKAWLKRTDGSLFFYPSPAIAQAMLDEDSYTDWKERGGVVTEFGTEGAREVVFHSQAYERVANVNP